MKKQSKNKKIIITALILLIIAITYTQLKDTPINTNIFTQNTTDQTTYSPREVVDMFTLSTLGSLPNSLIDYTLAKTLMTEQYAQEFTNPSFIPQAYGIQDGPDKVEFETENIQGDQAEVVLIGYWGNDLTMRWKFNLEKENGDWRLALINPGQ